MRRGFRLLAVSLLSCATLPAQQTPHPAGHTLVIIPFENTSLTPAMEWLGEGFAETLRWQLDSPVLYVATREERLQACDREGIPAGLHPSRATLYRLTEQMDLDYAVLGSYRIDGENATATAQLLDMRAPRLLPSVTESARLSELGQVQSALSWDLLHQIRTDFSIPKDKYIAGVPLLRLDALDNYIHGILASAPSEKTRYFTVALSADPSFAQASLELGKTYFGQKSYDSAIAALEKISPSLPLAREANFYLGLSSYARGDYESAESAFQFVASRLPLAEVYNNLGVVASRLGQKKSAAYFEKAIQDDPSDPDYHFNLALALARSGDKSALTDELHLALERRHDDAEAAALLNELSLAAHSTAAGAIKLPAERLKRNYPESAFRQMTIQIQTWAEQQFAHADPNTRARYHLELGKELLAHGFFGDAESEFRHAATIDPAGPAPVTALGELADARGDSNEARTQAEASLRIHESVDAYLLLARLDLRQDRTNTAAKSLERVLQLEPGNRTAQDLKRTLAAKLAGKAQP
ncbi:MAG: tetratricopeptide repeat protein [Terriglobales bacterium]